MANETPLPKIKGPIEILEENGMWPIDSKTSKGRSIDEPILIEGVHFYVNMEYRIMNILFSGKKHELLLQSLCEIEGRKIDAMLVKVTNYDGSEEHTEKVFFDITEGFNAL